MGVTISDMKTVRVQLTNTSPQENGVQHQPIFLHHINKLTDDCRICALNKLLSESGNSSSL
jgi:hypothetical protein